MTNSLANG